MRATESNRTSITEPLLYTRAEAAELLAICLRSVDKLIDDGELEAIHMGRSRSVRITRENLLRFIAKQRKRGGEQ